MSGMPSINISFIEKAATAIARSARGSVGLILRGAVPATNPVVCTTESDIGSTWSAVNKQYVKDALKGHEKTPLYVSCYFVATDADSYADALTYFSKKHVDYLAVPTIATDELESSVVSWVKNEWENKNYTMVVLPNVAGDFEGIVNFTTDDIEVGSNTYTPEQYTPRIAGLLAGTAIDTSATYAELNEVEDVEALTKAERDAAVNAGKLILYHDGEKVKVGRAVTSFVTTTSTKGESFKKIRLVDTMRTISTDIHRTIEDKYIGKWPNTYDNKVLLICAILAYLEVLKNDQLVQPGYSIEIDIEANKTYLQSKGVDVTQMTDDEIKKADTGDNVYLKGRMKLVDVMEDVDLPIYI